MQRVCPILGIPTDVEIIDQHGDWKLVRCRQTGFVFLADPPEYEQLTQEFAWETSLESQHQRRKEQAPIRSTLSGGLKKARLFLYRRRNKLFDVLRKALEPKKTHLTVLDIGCGSGEFMTDIGKRFSQMGITIQPYGIEVSQSLAELARQRFEKLSGSVIFANALEGTQQFEPKQIDVVAMASFLEHEANPLTLLQNVHRILADDGVVAVKVPNLDSWNRYFWGKDWCGYRFPDHVNYFTPRTLAILAKESGFRMRPQQLSDRLPTNDNMYGVLTKGN